MTMHKQPIAQRAPDSANGPSSARAALRMMGLNPQTTLSDTIVATPKRSRDCVSPFTPLCCAIRVAGATKHGARPGCAGRSNQRRDREKAKGGRPFLGPAALVVPRGMKVARGSPRRSSFARQGPGSHPARSEAGEIVGGIDRGRSLAQFEVELRRVDVAGVAGLGDHLAALDLLAALDVELAVVAVSGDEAVGVLDE